MTAAACLKVVLTSNKNASGADVLATIGKVTTSFLDTRWFWPRQYNAVNTTSYMLSDPAARSINTQEIQTLSAELQEKLFGAGSEGDVQLAVFEGPQEDASRFSRLSMDELRRLVNAEDTETLHLHGRLLKVNPSSVEVLKNLQDEGDMEIWDTFVDATDPGHSRLLYRGLYFFLRQQFVASLTSRWKPSEKSLQTLLAGPAHYPADQEAFDFETIEEILSRFQDASAIPSTIYIPLSYTGLIRRNSLERYIQQFHRLSHLPKEFLTAMVYDVPRSPQHNALCDLKLALAPYFSAIDLTVVDPDIHIDMLDTRGIRSVTLSLPMGEETFRNDSIRRFMSRGKIFQARKLWPIIGNVRTRHELHTCIKCKAPFVHGPAVSGILETPVGLVPFMADGLPMMATSALRRS